MSFKLTSGIVGIQHSVTAGSNFSGVLPSDENPAFDPKRSVLVYSPSETGQAGLFDLHQFIEHRISAHVVSVSLFSKGSFSFEIFVTSGIPGDDVAYDLPAGNGADNCMYMLYLDILPSQKIRVVTTGGTQDIFCILKTGLGDMVPGRTLG